MSFPNAFILGAARCATTWLHRSLTSGTNVAGSSIHKEPGSLWELVGEERFPQFVPLEAYEDSFPDVPVRLDATPTYYATPKAARVVAERGGKAVIQLRDPVDRVVSNWAYSKNNNNEPEPFEKAIRLADERWTSAPNRMKAYVKLSEYDTLIPPIKEILGDDLMIVRMETLFKDKATTERVFARICDHLDIEGAQPIHRVVNAHQDAVKGKGRPLGGFLERTLKIPRPILDRIDKLRRVGTSHDPEVPDWLEQRLAPARKWLKSSPMVDIR